MYEKGLCSIICLGYNHARFIRKTIESIWGQGYKKIEIIAVDDGSKDESITILSELAEISPLPMRVIGQKNTGNVGRNFNNGLKTAKGEFILFISLDDMLTSDAVGDKIGLMLQDEKIAFVANTMVKIIDGNGQNPKNMQLSCEIEKMQDVVVDDLLDLEYKSFHSFFIQNCIFRRDMVEAVAGFDEDMTGDDIVLRIKTFLYLKDHPQYNFKLINKPGVYYRMHDDNVSKNHIRQIKIVTECLERFFPGRPVPKVLVEWVRGAIKANYFEEYLKIFTLNKVASNLLLEKDVQKEIIKSIIGYVNIAIPILKKEKTGGKRSVTLFGLIKYYYKK